MNDCRTQYEDEGQSLLPALQGTGYWLELHDFALEAAVRLGNMPEAIRWGSVLAGMP